MLLDELATSGASLGQAGLPDLRFCDPRHTAASLMLHQGIYPWGVQEDLGYSKIIITLHIYMQALPSLKVEAAAKRDGLIAGTYP
jgi:integrase